MSPRGPTADRERAVEARFAARFGVVLVLLVATFVVLASSPSKSWTAVLAVVLQGATLLAALSASEVPRRLYRIAAYVVFAAVLSAAITTLLFDSSNVHGAVLALSALLVAGAPVAIAWSIRRRGVIDARSVLGAICIYVLVGMLWALVYLTIGTVSSAPFFAQTRNASTADYMYFSFVTQTTVGYGDLTAAGGLGRALAVLEALIGPIYLVTVVAVLVTGLGRTRTHT